MLPHVWDARSASLAALVIASATTRRSIGIQPRDRAWLQRDRLKTRDANWNGFVSGSPDSHHFLSIRRTAATARRHWGFVIEIIADSIRIEHLGGNELPANVAKTVTKSEFVAGIDPEAVGEGQRPAGFLHDPSPGKRRQSRADRRREKERFGVARTVGLLSKAAFFAADKICSISANPESISKTGHIP